MKASWPYLLNRSSSLSLGLRGWWPGSGGGESRIRNLGPHLASSGAFAGTMPSNGWWAQSIDGGKEAVQLDGTSSRITANPPAFSVPFSFACWVRFDNLLANQALLCVTNNGTSYGRLLVMYYQPFGRLLVDTGAVTNAQCLAAVYANTWHHVCAVYRSASERSIFLDGGNKATDTTYAEMLTPDLVEFGSYLNSTHLAGRMAEIGIWNRALSDSEVYRLWHPSTRWDLRRTVDNSVWVSGGGATEEASQQFLTLLGVG